MGRRRVPKQVKVYNNFNYDREKIKLLRLMEENAPGQCRFTDPRSKQQKERHSANGLPASLQLLQNIQRGQGQVGVHIHQRNNKGKAVQVRLESKRLHWRLLRIRVVR